MIGTARALFAVAAIGWPGAFAASAGAVSEEPVRPRVIVETDAGGDPDDEQSLVRLLLHANDLDIAGIVANRERARDGENRNPIRDGLGIVRAQLDAYAVLHARLATHDPRYPDPETLRARTVAGYADRSDGVDSIVRAVDEGPVWFCNWGTDAGSSPSNLLRALDRVREERGEAGYAAFKGRIRLSSAEKFGAHVWEIGPPFPIWVDTFRPELDGKRWYHRFSALTATAGGFDVERDAIRGGGPLGSLYPTNTSPRQKEGDTMTFLYLLPIGPGDPEHPEWGSWGGRYGLREDAGGRPYYWANRVEEWNGTTSRDNTVGRWAEAIQNEFRARLSWCVRDYGDANHPPAPRVAGELRRRVRAGDRIAIDATGSTDPDGDGLRFLWEADRAATGVRGEGLGIESPRSPRTFVRVPDDAIGQSLHLLLSCSDEGDPPLTRYVRLIFDVESGDR